MCCVKAAIHVIALLNSKHNNPKLFCLSSQGEALDHFSCQFLSFSNSNNVPIMVDVTKYYIRAL